MRYEKIKFKDFSAGELDQYSDEIGIQSSDKVILENKTLNSCYQLEKTEFSGYSDLSGAFLHPYDNRRYILTTRDSDNHLCLFSFPAGTGTLTLYKDFGVDCNGISLSYFKGLTIVKYSLSGVYYLAYTDTPNISASWIIIPFPLEGLTTTTYQDKKIALKSLGYYSDVSDLYTSDDGINYNLKKSNFPGTSLINIGESLFSYSSRRSMTLYKINSDFSTEVFKRGFKFTSIAGFNDILFYTYTQYIAFYPSILYITTMYTMTEDGTISIFKVFPEHIYPEFIGSTHDKLYFYVSTNTSPSTIDIYSIDKNGAIIKEYSYSDDNSYLWYLLSDSSSNDFLSYDETGEPIFAVQLFTDKAKNRVSDSGFETTIVDKGEILPKQIILKHDPLITGTSVEVYARKDKATSWGSIILTSNTAGSIKKKYTFPKNTKCDYIQYKIIMKTTDTTKYVNNIELEFLYQKCGLANSQ